MLYHADTITHLPSLGYTLTMQDKTRPNYTITKPIITFTGTELDHTPLSPHMT